MKKLFLLFALAFVAMSCGDHCPSLCPSNEIWYTNGSTTEPINPSEEDVFGVNIISNTYDSEKECWVIKFDGDVTTIGGGAFRGCRSLTSVTIPDSVTTIGYMAFFECSSLTSVYCKATTPPTLGNGYVFDDNASGRKIYVTATSVDDYKSAENWSEYAADIVGYDFETGEVVAE